MFDYKYSKFDSIEIMCWESNTPDAYDNIIRAVGALNKQVTNNDTVLTELRWTSINRKYCIETCLTAPCY